MAAPAARTAHTISAVGHAHIDSAWLWPVRETVRKCARTFSNVAALGDQYPELVFACSQAQQWWWMKHSYPAIYERMKEQVRQGQVVPVGGMWVESDTNVTGGGVAGPPARVRQALLSFRAGRGDRRGLAAGLLRLLRRPASARSSCRGPAGSSPRSFPGTTPTSSRITPSGGRASTAAGFSPTSRPSTPTTPRCCPPSWPMPPSNYAERGFGTRSLVPFGYGDGGGGPTREMMERARRSGRPRRVAAGRRWKLRPSSLPPPRPSHPDAPVWSGELYLELHRGTITSQVEIKQGNRRCENLAARGRAVVDRRPGGGSPPTTPTTSWRKSGGTSSSTSSTTFSPARRSPWSTTKPSPATPGLRLGWRTHRARHLRPVWGRGQCPWPSTPPLTAGRALPALSAGRWPPAEQARIRRQWCQRTAVASRTT